MDDIVSSKANIVKVADGFTFTDGPLWHPDGYLLFNDLPANKILKYTPANRISTFLEKSGTIDPESVAEERGSKGSPHSTIR